MVKGSRPKLVGRLLVLVMLGVLAVLSWRFLTTAPIFAVKSVSVEGDSDDVVSSQIKSASLGQNIFSFPEGIITEEAKKNLLVEGVTFEKRYPSEVVAKVTFRRAVMTWQSQNGRFLVDQEGVAFTNAQNEPLPQASDPESHLKLGEKLSDKQVNETLAVVRVIGDRLTVLTIGISGENINVQLSSGVRVILDGRSDLVQEQNALQLILTQAKIEGKLPKVVDLRYGKPTVTY